MKRKAVSGWFIVSLIFMIWIMQFVVSGFYAAMTLNQGKQVTGEGFRRNAAAEKLLEAPCATKSRGVFYKTSVMSGDLRCVTPTFKLHVRFTSEALPNGTMGWTLLTRVGAVGYSLDAQDFQIKVRQKRYFSNLKDSYQVMIYDQQEDKMYPARMEVRGQFMPGVLN